LDLGVRILKWLGKQIEQYDSNSVGFSLFGVRNVSFRGGVLTRSMLKSGWSD
jgi:hypothetical protein